MKLVASEKREYMEVTCATSQFRAWLKLVAREKSMFMDVTAAVFQSSCWLKLVAPCDKK